LPLPLPAADRELQHTRSLSFKGYRRKDQLWDIEGHLTDVRPHDLHFPGGSRQAGEAIHSMWLRLTVDVTGMIKEVHASTDASPFNDVCGENIESRYRCLVGIRVGSPYACRRIAAGGRYQTIQSRRLPCAGYLKTRGGAISSTLVQNEA
jgi:hypothetical protein